MNNELSGGIYKIEDKAPPAEPVNFSGADFGFALAMFVCGFLYWNLIRVETLGAGVSIFAVVFCLITGIYLGINGSRQTKASLFYLAVVALSASSFFLFDNNMIKGFNFIFLSVMAVYWIAVSTGRRLEKGLSIALTGDLVNQLLVVPFYNFNCGFLGMKARDGGKKRGKNFLNAFLGFLIFLPVLLIVISLLASADAAFEQLIDRVRISISADVLSYIVQIVLGIPVACYLFGLIYGNVRGRHTEHITLESVQRAGIGFRFVPGAAVYSALTLLNVVFLVFFLSQASYLFSAFNDHLPETMTYAEYARRGFFELCTVAAINLCVIAGAHLFTNRGEKAGRPESKEGATDGGNKGQENASAEVNRQEHTAGLTKGQEDPAGMMSSAENTSGLTKGQAEATATEPPKGLKGETVALCVFTVLLIATALSKMILYINYYGLTQLRVYTTSFMLLLLILFVIIAARQFKRFNGTRIAAISFTIGFLVLCYANVDGVIARYNIDRYLEGSLESLDVEALGWLSDAAVPPMFDLYQKTGDDELKIRLESAIVGEPEWDVFAPQRKDTFRDFNMQTWKADQIRDKF